MAHDLLSCDCVCFPRHFSVISVAGQTGPNSNVLPLSNGLNNVIVLSLSRLAMVAIFVDTGRWMRMVF